MILYPHKALLGCKVDRPPTGERVADRGDSLNSTVRRRSRIVG